MDAIIRGSAVTKRWGDVVALDAVDVDVPGGVTGLLGANGAGKTTLLGLVLGFHAPDGGTLEVLGDDPATSGPAVRARVGYAPEHDALPPEARAQELVRHVAELHGIPRRAAVVRASETLDLVGLGEERLRPVGTMSTGQKQRVKIAQAVAHDPRLLLLDEPTNGLDPLQRDDMLALIRRIGHELGIHVVLSTHLLAEVEKVCDHAVILHEGRLAGVTDLRTAATPGGRYRVELDGTDAAVTAALAGFDTSPVPGAAPGRVTIELPDDAALDRLRDAVADADVGLRRLEPVAQSLQERFLVPEDVA